jgi:hypothetical protein
MPRWKELPGSLDDRARQLVVQMRLLKDRSGLSTTSLAAKTAYSRSSWARYLNGTALPPRRAVAELARLGGADATRLLVLHELAEATWARTEPAGGDGGSPTDRDCAPASTEEPRRTSRRFPWAAAVGATAVTVLLVGLVVAAPWEEGHGGASRTSRTSVRPTGTGVYSYQPGRTYDCAVRRERGLLRAGHSDSRVAVLQSGSTSWDVVEAQCLLRHHGFSPGPVDGIFGELTERAVQRFQEKRGLVVDGKVGPHTWGALRR